jgi:hypothetical protein
MLCLIPFSTYSGSMHTKSFPCTLWFAGNIGNLITLMWHTWIKKTLKISPIEHMRILDNPTSDSISHPLPWHQCWIVVPKNKWKVLKKWRQFWCTIRCRSPPLLCFLLLSSWQSCPPRKCKKQSYHHQVQIHPNSPPQWHLQWHPIHSQHC